MAVDVVVSRTCPRCGDVMIYEYRCRRGHDVRRWMWWCPSCLCERIDWTRKFE